jgi:WXG100 family type VII secretion target
MSGFGVTPAELAALQAFVTDAAGAARSAVDGFRSQAAGVVWRGAAGHSMRAAWEEWLDGAALVVGALDELARLVGTAGTSYTGTDESVRTAVAAAAV